MISGARYVHTNLIARDWQALARFYQAHFGCVPVLPERNYAGRDLEAGTGVPGASLCGVHLRLPGVDAKGPTLEIFTYSRLADGAAPAANRPGFAHIAFEVTSVRAARDEIIGAGGQAVGDVVALETATGARVTWCYVTDPEGNIIELQSWSPDPG
jgi:catechol 2,3-dioxygenase-like lactoylglutathione lyase family enzyme